jgi:hypothetical protein
VLGTPADEVDKLFQATDGEGKEGEKSAAE